MSGTPREILYEFNRIGAYVKVIAIDAQTGEEISITGAAAAHKEHLQLLAFNRLQQILAKKGLL